MAVRIIKNFTTINYTVRDIGDIVIPSNGAVDIGGDENQLIKLATSNDLLNILVLGDSKIIVNDGSRDYSMAQGIDLIRRITTPVQLDEIGRPVVRSDSRRANYDTVFAGVGDDLATNKIGVGHEFRWDFSDDLGLVAAPSGFKRKRIDWRFCDLVYMKEGAIYYFDAPKGSYADFYLICPAGYPYYRKTIDAYGNVTQIPTIASQETIFVHWVNKFWLEGTAPMGHDLSTESAAGTPAPSYLIWRAEFTTPETDTEFHGHFELEFYRPRTIIS